jgi:rubrerythrin
MEQKNAKFTSILRILEALPFNRRTEVYVEKLIESLKNEGYVIDAKLVEEKLKWLRGEDIPMATMDMSAHILKCPECLSQMKWNGNVCLSNPVQYPWVCPNCKYTKYLTTEEHLTTNLNNY